MRRIPWVGLPADRRQIGLHPFHAVGEKYLRAVTEVAGALPVLIPALGRGLALRGLLADLDGLVLPGSPSNIEPHQYGDEPSWPGNLHDPHRDDTTLRLVPLAIELGLPVLGLCRGLQEVNVALGGSLHQKLYEVEGFDDHREDDTLPVDEQYAPTHPVRLTEGGLLARLAGTGEVQVNSLHGQGVERLGRGLVVEARAPDGVIEAVRLDRPDRFVLAVQWHPEWKPAGNPFSMAIFRAFGDACRARAARRRNSR